MKNASDTGCVPGPSPALKEFHLLTFFFFFYSFLTFDPRSSQKTTRAWRPSPRPWRRTSCLPTWTTTRGGNARRPVVTLISATARRFLQLTWLFLSVLQWHFRCHVFCQQHRRGDGHSARWAAWSSRGARTHAMQTSGLFQPRSVCFGLFQGTRGTTSTSSTRERWM